MKRHCIIARAAEILEARKDRSAWNKAVTADAIDLLEAIDDTIEGIYEKYRYTDEGGGDHVWELLKDPGRIEKAMLNGARNWREYSWGGGGLIYNGDIAKHYCTPSELEKTRHGERRPNNSEEWLDVQARALFQAAQRVKDAIRIARSKTYSMNADCYTWGHE